MKQNYIFEPLNKINHDRENFDCGVLVLNEFLQTKANKEMKQKLNSTYVCTLSGEHTPKPIAGFYTLSSSPLILSAIPKELSKHIPKNYQIPTAKIGRLARDKNHPGVGSLLLKDALFRVLDMSSTLGIYGVEVNAKDEAAKSFYEKFGFIPFVDDKYSLFISLKTVLNALD